MIYRNVAYCSGNMIKKLRRVRNKVFFILLLYYIYYS